MQIFVYFISEDNQLKWRIKKDNTERKKEESKLYQSKPNC